MWINFEKTYLNGSSNYIYTKELNKLIALAYNSSEHKGIAEYIGKFQTWMEELDVLHTHKYNNNEKKNILLRNLQSDYPFGKGRFRSFDHTYCFFFINNSLDDTFHCQFFHSVFYSRRRGTAIGYLLINEKE